VLIARREFPFRIDQDDGPQPRQAESLPSLEGRVEQDRERQDLAAPDVLDDRLQRPIDVGHRFQRSLRVHANPKELETVTWRRVLRIESHKLSLGPGCLPGAPVPVGGRSWRKEQRGNGPQGRGKAGQAGHPSRRCRADARAWARSPYEWPTSTPCSGS